MAAAIPLISTGIGALGSYLGSRGAQKQADTSYANQNAAYAKQGQLAEAMTGIAKDRYTLAKPAYDKAMGYYSGILGGNQAGALQAVSPDIRRLTDLSQGAQSAIDHRLTGASRDMATSDLLRNRYADIAQLTGAPRQNAAQTLLGEGRSGITGLQDAYSTGANIYGAQGAGYSDAYRSANSRVSDINTQWGNFGTSLSKAFGPGLISMLTKGKIPNVNLRATGGADSYGVPTIR